MVLIADLRARFSAEGLDAIGQGARQARQDLQTVEQQARATGAQLDELARRASTANPALGSPQSFRTIFERQGLTGAQAAQMLGTSTGAAGAAASAATGGSHAGGGADGIFGLTFGRALQVAGAITGIQLGLSAAIGLARQFHDQIAGAVDSERQLELAVRATNAAYGPAQGAALGAAAQRFTSNAATVGSQADFLQAAGSLQTLSTQYGLTTSQVERLVTAAGALARIHGTELAPAVKALQGVLEGNVNAAQAYNITLTDSAGRIRGVGASYDELVSISGRARAEQILLAQTFSEIKLQQDNARGSSDQLASAYERLSRAADQSRTRAGGAFRDPAVGIVGGLANIFEAFQPGSRGLRVLDPTGGYATGQARLAALPPVPLELQGVTAAENALAAAQQGVATATGRATAAAQTQLTTYEALRVQITRNLETLQRIGEIQSQYGGIQRALQGPGFGLAPLAPGQAAAMGAAQAAQDIQAARERSVAQGTGVASTMRRQLESAINTAREIGPNAVAAAQQELAVFEQRAAVHASTIEAEHRATVLNVQAAEQQSRIEAVTLTQRERSLRMLRDTVELRREDVNLQMHGVEANQAVIRAQQAAQGPQSALEDAQYRSTRASVLAQARVARQLQGKDVSGLPSYDELIRMNVQGQFAAAEAGPAALEAGRAVQLAQRPATAAGLAQQLNQSQIQLQELAVDLQNLGDLPGQTALELELLQTNRDQLGIQRELRDLTRRLVELMGGQNGPFDVTSAVESALSRGITESEHSATIPASPQLAGARR